LWKDAEFSYFRGIFTVGLIRTACIFIELAIYRRTWIIGARDGV
jgi:hypothetical protein